MKIVIVGSVIFSKDLILIRKKNGCKIDGIIGKKNSNYHSDFCDLVSYFKRKGYNCTYSKNINDKKTYLWLKKINPDLILCLGWSNLFKRKILKLPRLGVIGYHPADLPKNKGRHPIIWSLALGLKKVASTFFLMNEKADSGKIISKKYLIVKKDTYAAQLYNDLNKIAGLQLISILKKIQKNKKISTIKAIKTDKKIKDNFWRKRNFEDGKIDWRMSAKNIYNLVRSLSKPYPGAHFFYNKKLIKLLETSIIIYKKKNIEPGKILGKYKKNPIIKCGDNALMLKKYYPKINFKKNSYSQ